MEISIRWIGIETKLMESWMELANKWIELETNWWNPDWKWLEYEIETGENMNADLLFSVSSFKQWIGGHDEQIEKNKLNTINWIRWVEENH